MLSASLIVGLAVYVIAARACLQLVAPPWRALAFCAVNLAAVVFAFRAIVSPVGACVYLALFVGLYGLTRAFASATGSRPLIPLVAPIVLLASIKYVPLLAPSIAESWTPWLASFVGVSYCAFRASHLTAEVRNRATPMPNLAEYLAFVLFLPTLSVGPISPYRRFRESMLEPMTGTTCYARSALRIVVGAAKYFVLANVVGPLTFQGMMWDWHGHAPIDLPIAAVAYLLYLYANFSGFCDMAIGLAGLIGISVPENFDRPFGARNVREYWTRWHITLSDYMNAIVFTPLATALGTLGGGRFVKHGVAIAIFVVFVLIGLWHGPGWGFLVYGVLHGVAVVVVHYYSLALKRVLSREQLTRYMASGSIRALGRTLTFSWAAFTLVFFANDPTQLASVVARTRFPDWLAPSVEERSIDWPEGLVPGHVHALDLGAASPDTYGLASSGETRIAPTALRFARDTSLRSAGSLHVSGDARTAEFDPVHRLVGIRVLLDEGRTVDLTGHTIAFDLFVPDAVPLDFYFVSLATGAFGPLTISAARPAERGSWVTVRFDPSHDALEYVKGTPLNDYADTPALLPVYLRRVTELRLELYTSAPDGTELEVYLDDLRID